MKIIEGEKGIVTIQLDIGSIVDQISMLIVNKSLEKISALIPKDQQLANYEFSIDELNLPARARHCLRNEKIFTVGDLLMHSEADLSHIKNMGTQSVSDIIEKLKLYGLSLRENSQKKLKLVLREAD
jgi:DNA-directed RNA polymerase alpha subunit